MKSVLLYSFLVGGAHARELISSDRFLLKILDRTVSFQDVEFQHRNLKALNCIFSDSLVLMYFEKDFIKDLGSFVSGFPKEDEKARLYLHEHKEQLKKLRNFFKLLRYAEEQKTHVTPQLTKVIREAARENGCDQDVLYKEGLKTNFLNLLQMELYFRSRYGGQIKDKVKAFDTIRPSIDLFMESLDKQFSHEYYW